MPDDNLWDVYVSFLTPNLVVNMRLVGEQYSVSISLVSMEIKNKKNIFYILNTFYLRLYGVRHMVKDHSDSEKGNSENRICNTVEELRNDQYILPFLFTQNSDACCVDVLLFVD